MRRLLAAAFVLVLAGSVSAAVTADLRLEEKGNTLWSYMVVHGIADCPAAGSVTIEYTSPDKVFDSSSYEASWKACTNGVAHTRARRTIQFTEKGKTFRAVGIWKVRVLAGDVVLAESSYEVK